MKTLKLQSFNIFGQKRKEGFVQFDFENNTFITNSGKQFNVVDDYEFTYKIQKSQIKASGGIYGFFSFMNEINESTSPFNPSLTEMFIEL